MSLTFTYRPTSEAHRILHADDHLLLVAKPVGLLSVPGKGEDRADCLIARLRDTHPQVLLVHRLDLDTSGVMVFALTPHAQRHLGLQFERRHVSKTYLARVAGRLAPETGRVDAPLRVDWPNRPRQMIAPDGRTAQTDWRVLAASDAESRVRLTPLTGRSHQLRVHMLSLGHPILGDPLYAEGPARDDHPRLMLHAETLRLRHPEGGAWLTFSDPAPF